MIAKLRGIIDSLYEDSIILDVGGVGYSVLLPQRLLSSLHVGEELSILTHQIFRQDQQFLCGFQTPYELSVFKSLLNVPGIGTKSALAILSALSPENLAIAVATQDTEALLQISGIGQKSAARILLELKDKSSLKLTDLPPTGLPSSNTNDAILGLVSLGYSKGQVVEVVSKIAQRIAPDSQANELIVLALKELK